MHRSQQELSLVTGRLLTKLQHSWQRFGIPRVPNSKSALRQQKLIIKRKRWILYNNFHNARDFSSRLHVLTTSISGEFKAGWESDCCTIETILPSPKRLKHSRWLREFPDIFVEFSSETEVTVYELPLKSDEENANSWWWFWTCFCTRRSANTANASHQSWSNIEPLSPNLPFTVCSSAPYMVTFVRSVWWWRFDREGYGFHSEVSWLLAIDPRRRIVIKFVQARDQEFFVRSQHRDVLAFV